MDGIAVRCQGIHHHVGLSPHPMIHREGQFSTTSRVVIIAVSMYTCGLVVDHAKDGTAASAMLVTSANQLEK